MEKDGGERPIAFFSQKLNPWWAKYSVTEKECFAGVLAMERFRPYIEMMPFTIIADLSSLKCLMSLKDLSCWLSRWSFKLQRLTSSLSTARAQKMSWHILSSSRGSGS